MKNKNILFWLKLHRMADDGGDGGGDDSGGGGDGGSLLPASGGAAGGGGDGGADDSSGGAAGGEPAEIARTDEKGIAYDKDDNVVHYGDPERPWYRKDKYKSIDDQAKSYVDLEKKLGERNELTGAPEDGKYNLTMPEGIEGEFAEDDPLLKNFMGVAKELNLSQGAFDKILHQYLTAERESLQSNKEEQIKLLGDNADRRLESLGAWGSKNLDAETFEVFRGVASTAAGVQMLEAMVNNSREHSIGANSQDYSPASGITKQQLQEMLNKKDPETGQRLASIDPDYKKKVDKAYADFYGSEPKSTVVG